MQSQIQFLCTVSTLYYYIIYIIIGYLFLHRYGVIALVLKIISRHFSRVSFFIDDLYSLSCTLMTGIRNNEIWCFWLDEQPKKAQLRPVQRVFRHMGVACISLSTFFRHQKVSWSYKQDYIF
jgi:hypothetical protein